MVALGTGVVAVVAGAVVVTVGAGVVGVLVAGVVAVAAGVVVAGVVKEVPEVVPAALPVRGEVCAVAAAGGVVDPAAGRVAEAASAVTGAVPVTVGASTCTGSVVVPAGLAGVPVVLALSRSRWKRCVRSSTTLAGTRYTARAATSKAAPPSSTGFLSSARETIGSWLAARSRKGWFRPGVTRSSEASPPPRGSMASTGSASIFSARHTERASARAKVASGSSL
ncbi:hypothetical protein CDN98_20525 [Roseateles terrae]|nr:hypothetical protein CDN98_20525 [Roseateles terrae]